ncbi:MULTISPECIES: LysR family transcriptional regulator [Paraburkholderia]|jgi:DNA-binding transcriptional LysR family regulator|uniref:Transcriptional regulator, LysR family n=1 Tax=Paraburkholderia phenazinium TaxID=60549 RepID=A0A1N6G6P4_9BURK|nr:LysR family transcriptional regulator [Paraburkholderia phenazinium]SIO03216.1 transcriptional regulator, LysR family [Paraburkholderia phenazinium]
MNIYSVDLNLLKVFEAIYVERSVSRAAIRLGLTQPSVSHGLMRLRSLFGDPLFVRLNGGVEPTVAATRIAPSIQQAMRNLQVTLDEGSRFDPSSGRRTFLIHMSDFGEVVFLPPLMRELKARAPGIRIETCQLDGIELTHALESGQIDFALGHLPMLADQFQSEYLFAEEYGILAPSSGAPDAPFDAASDQSEFVVVTSHPETLKILVAHGLQDRVRLSVPHFMVLPAIFAATGFAAVVPHYVSEVFDKIDQKHAYRYSTLSGSRHEMKISVYWFRRYSTDPGNIWLRDLMIELFKTSTRARKGQMRSVR